MSGRFIAAAVTDWSSWRVALAVLGLIGGLAAVIFWRQLPQSRHFRVRAAQLGRILADTRALFADRALPCLFLTAFLMMGAFVGLYNYLGFRLGAAPSDSARPSSARSSCSIWWAPGRRPGAGSWQTATVVAVSCG